MNARADGKPADPISAALAETLRPLVLQCVREALAEHVAAEQPKPEVLTVDQLCQALQMGRTTLHKLREKGLPTLWFGESPRFRLVDVLAWAAQQPPKE